MCAVRSRTLLFVFISCILFAPVCLVALERQIASIHRKEHVDACIVYAVPGMLLRVDVRNVFVFVLSFPSKTNNFVFHLKHRLNLRATSRRKICQNNVQSSTVFDVK